MKTKQIILVGAGLAGSLLAIYLARRGFDVQVFEKRPDMRQHHISAGRSINLSLSERGIHALKEVGLYQKIEKELVTMPGRMLHRINKSLQFQAYGRNKGDVHYSVSRAVLNRLLLDAAEATGRVTYFFEEHCSDLNLNTNQLTFKNGTNQKFHQIDFEVVIGTDGAGSAICRVLNEVQAIHCGHDLLAHGYKELTIPAGHDGEFLIEKNALHIWPRGGYMLIALPNTDGSFTATLFLPLTGADSFESLADEHSILDFFNTQFSDAVPLITNLISDFKSHPVGSLGTIRCAPWHVDGRVLLLGDAAHAIVPFHGQGMNCAFEDCYAFDQCLATCTDWETLFTKVEALRKSNADAIADMALENYTEMRDSVRDPKFQLRKQIEWLLEERHSERFISRYSMVMFHRIPYAEVQKRGVVQSAILARLSEQVERIEQVDIQLAEQLVNEKLVPIKTLAKFQ